MRGIDIRDLDDPESRLTLRRLWVIWTNLPPGNRITQSVSGMTDEETLWGVEAYILANVFDAVQALTHLTHTMNVPKGKQKPKPPKPHPRPGTKNAARPRPRDWFPGATVVER